MKHNTTERERERKREKKEEKKKQTKKSKNQKTNQKSAESATDESTFYETHFLVFFSEFLGEERKEDVLIFITRDTEDTRTKPHTFHRNSLNFGDGKRRFVGERDFETF